jgi:hypothetical protein
MSADKSFLDSAAALPRDLTTGHIFKAVDYVERTATDFIDLYYEQKNIFSAVVGILGAKALDQFSPWERVPHHHEMQQRFPDLRHRKGGKKPKPDDCLESKGSSRPWAVQAHYDHPGWYVIWRYLVDETGSIEPDRRVILWRVDVAFLEKADWKYEGSSAGKTGGGRTHTFGLKEPRSYLKNAGVYCRKDIVLKAGKPVPTNGDD